MLRNSVLKKWTLSIENFFMNIFPKAKGEKSGAEKLRKI